MTDLPITGVLFVCLGNICRSPLAEGVFLHHARARGVHTEFDIDSCGTAHWHIGSPPDERSVAVAAAHGVTLPSVGRQLNPVTDFARFDWIIPMDVANAEDILAEGAQPERVRLLLSFHPEMRALQREDQQVPDPYYGGQRGFRNVYEMIDAACAAMLDEFLED